MISEGQHWYVVRSQPNAEQKAIAHLNRQGFATYLPRYLKRRRHARKVEIVPAPLFPRYLFVAIDMAAQRWRVIQSTIGVSQLVCNGDLPACVPQQMIEQLRGREDDRGYVQMDRHPSFETGDKVRVVDGHFLDCLGLFEAISGEERVAILLELLGRKVRVVLDVDMIAAA